MNLVQKYRGGITYGDSFATRELLLRPEWSSDQQLYFESYDANMYPLPDYEKWTKLGKQKLLQAIDEKIPENITIIVDGTIVRNLR